MNKIIAFSGSNHSGSINQKLVHYAVDQILYIDAEVYDLRAFDAPMYSIDLEKSDGIPIQELIRKFENVVESVSFQEAR